MSEKIVSFSNGAWTILKRDANNSGVYLWRQPDFSDVFLVSSKQVAEQNMAQLQLKDYIAYQFPDRQILLSLLESMASGGVTSVASDPGEVGPIVIPIQNVIDQLRSMNTK